MTSPRVFHTAWQKTTSRRYCSDSSLAMVGAESCISRKTMALLAVSLIMVTHWVRVERTGYSASLHSPANTPSSGQTRPSQLRASSSDPTPPPTEGAWAELLPGYASSAVELPPGGWDGATCNISSRVSAAETQTRAGPSTTHPTAALQYGLHADRGQHIMLRGLPGVQIRAKVTVWKEQTYRDVAEDRDMQAEQDGTAQVAMVTVEMKVLLENPPLKLPG